MRADAEAYELVCEIAGAGGFRDRVKSALARVAIATGLSERRVRGLYHREARAIRADELDALRREAKRRRAEEAARVEYRNLIAAHRLAAIDEDFHRPTLDALESFAPPARAGRGPLDREER